MVYLKMFESNIGTVEKKHHATKKNLTNFNSKNNLSKGISNTSRHTSPQSTIRCLCGRNIAALHKTQNKIEPTMTSRKCFVTLSYIFSKIHSIKSLRKRT